MQKEQFEARIKELLPNTTEQAMDKWEDYAQYLLEEEEETSDFFYDAVYVELCLIKQHQGEQTATSLFNYGECSIILNCAVQRHCLRTAGHWIKFVTL